MSSPLPPLPPPPVSPPAGPVPASLYLVSPGAVSFGAAQVKKGASFTLRISASGVTPGEVLTLELKNSGGTVVWTSSTVAIPYSQGTVLVSFSAPTANGTYTLSPKFASNNGVAFSGNAQITTVDGI